jgi:hypothetical protein
MALAMLSGHTLPSSADEIYKSVDAEGHVVYSDRGSNAKAQKSEVRVVQPDAAEAARTAKEQQLLKAEDNQRKQRDALEAVEAHNKTEQEQQKQARCAQARDHYNSIKDVNLLYHLDSAGNRVFYSDTEADARREQARQAMVSACGQ